VEKLNKNISDLRNKKIVPLLAQLAIPSTIGMLANSLYSIVDTIFIGRGVGTLAIAGIGIVFPIHMIIMAIAQLVGLGAASIISRSLGKKDYRKAELTAGNSFLVIIVFGIIASTITFTFLNPILRVFGATEAILPYARDYLSIITFGFIFFPTLVSTNNLIRAEGSARTAMAIMILSTGLNIIMDPIFIFGLKLGIKGAAYATIISQFIGFIYAISYYLRGKSVLSIKARHFKLKFPILKEMFSLGFASFVRQASLSVLTIVINNSLGHYGGDLAIAIYSVANRLILFITMPLFGVVAGVQPIIGFNYGAKNNNRVKESLKMSILVTVIIGVFFFLILMIFPSFIIGIFSNDADLIQNSIFPIRMLMLFFPIIGSQLIGASFFQSIGKATPSILLSMVRQTFFLIPLILILPLFFNMTGIWVAFPIADLSAVAITSIFLRKEIAQINRRGSSEAGQLTLN